jgi:hypothetical protein
MVEAIVGAVISTLIVALWKYIAKQISKMHKSIIYLQYEHSATDYALGKSFSNGYFEYKKQKLEELLEKDNFINK